MHESYQKIRLSLNILWEPGSQVPREFAALVDGASNVGIQLLLWLGGWVVGELKSNANLNLTCSCS